jgi:hypothetical protein
MMDYRCSSTLVVVIVAICAAALLFGTTSAFAPPSSVAFTRHRTGGSSNSRLYTAASDDSEDEGWETKSSASSKASDAMAAIAQEDTKKKSGDGVLPELNGDFDWDMKFGSDMDWITDNVPGKIVLNEIELAKQVTALTQLENKWRTEREYNEYNADQKVGWVERAETLNGRTAMFFLITGLLTEYWTGFTLPGQVEEMLRIGGIIGFD